MPTTTTFGYKKPNSGESGNTVFQALEDNIDRIDGHTHDGVDSPPIPAQSVTGVDQTISSGSWVASGATGHYRQLVTVPAGFNFDEVQISFRTTGATGAYIHPTVERASTTTYYLYTTDNTIDMVAVYGG